ncbi:MAG TPA: glycoside hydrolase family 43 protein [Candidatus Kapabacteria bacterium]|nr:glycoside hydrolase family 43 protein [Candidatus Kapabacteria bacterium]
MRNLERFIASFCLLLCWGGLLSRPAFASDAHELDAAKAIGFANPVIANGADPWVIRWKENYYLSQSRRGASIWVNRSKTLSGIGTNNWVNVWSPPQRTPYSRNVWAPELHYLRGNWFIYFAADDGTNANHRMHVLQGTSQNPQDPFVFKGKISAPTDRWAIDGTVLKMPGDMLYFVWSGWEGMRDGAQNIYIAPMSDPLTISGERICISRPEFEWEKQGWPDVNEGPEPLWNGDLLFLIYSASGSWTDHYSLGQLTWTGGDPLDSRSWVKKSEPVFAATDSVFGPGHCSFVKSPDGKEDWILYHSAQAKGSGWRRQINMKRFTWRSDGSPDFGEPIAPGVAMDFPSGEVKVRNEEADRLAVPVGAH